MWQLCLYKLHLHLDIVSASELCLLKSGLGYNTEI